MKVVLVWTFLGGAAAVGVGPLEISDRLERCGGLRLDGTNRAHGFKCWLTMEACRRFSADRKTGALELLLSTPLKVEEILRGQWRALSKQFAAPAAVVLVADFIFLSSDRSDTNWGTGLGGLMIVFAADLITLSWWGCGPA